MVPFKRWLHASPVYDWINKFRHWYEWRRWQQGQFDHAPHYLKRNMLRTYARQYGLRSFVETGTFFGEMVDALKNEFVRIQSIELDEFLYERARKRFSRYPHISILHGNSGAKLPVALAAIEGPTLFWLDAHYSGGITALGEEVSPILRELGHIFQSPISGHMVVIDDARLFGTDPGYPVLDQLREFVSSKSPNWKMEVTNDVIRIYEA